MENLNEQAKAGFTPEQIKAIKAELLKLKPANPVRANGRVTTKDTIRQLAPTLAKMKAKGFTNAEIAEHLGKQGIVVKASTLGKYMRKERENTQIKKTMVLPQVIEEFETPLDSSI